MLFVHTISLLIVCSFSMSSAPTWQPNTLLNSGQHKPIFSVSRAPSTFTITQTFNASFTSIPKVVLSLQGYKQTPECGGCNVGFKSSIATVTTTSFTGSYTVYGSNMFFLHFMYLGVSPLANQYFVSYSLLTFTTGNLVNISSTSRVQTTIITNPAGQTFTTFPTNKIKSLVFLGGFKMNRGTTGTYINLTSSIVSSTSYSVTIATTGSVQIFQVSYFRLAFDKTAVMNGYVNIIDEFAYEGVNNSQLPTVTTITSTSFFYRNYLMGFNKIHILNTNTVTDLMLQLYITPQTIFSCNSTLGNFTNTLYNYVYADVFHHRKRVCNTSTPYFYFETLLCYDVCPLRTFNVTTNQYCEKCFANCLTCTGTQQNNCITCSNTSDFRVINVSSSQCICKNGYFENNTVVCALCSSYCLTCQASQQFCTSCDLISQFRTLVNNTCFCIGGYFQVGNPICSPCSPQCLTCEIISSNCTTCDLVNKFRTLVNNTCLCIDGYYETMINSSLICLPCHQTCFTCQNSSTSCIQCKASQNRQINISTNSCKCLSGFFQSSINSPLTCLICQSTCLTCQSAGNFCTSCNSSDLRSLNSTLNTCQCNYGTFQESSSNSSLCLLCHQICATCQISKINCLSCNSSHNRVLTVNKTCSCVDGYYQNSSSPIICQICNIKCLTCLISPFECLSCNSSNLRILNSTSKSCQCYSGYYQSPAGLCQICNNTCLTCTINQNNCTSCNITLFRTLDTLSKSCICQLGYYQDIFSVCKICTQSGCLECHLETIGFTQTCDRCDINLNYVIDIINSTTSSCKISLNPPQCGNGIVQPSEQCDDFNIQAKDGCSQACKVEQMHKCQFFSNGNGTSLCYYNGQMNMQISSIMKQLNSNRIKVIIKIIAEKCNLSKLKIYLESLTGIEVNFANRRFLQNIKNEERILQVSILQIYSSNFYISDMLGSTGYLGVTLNYTESIETLKNRNIKLLGSKLETLEKFYFYSTPSSIVNLEDPYNRIPLKAFSLEQYQLASLFSYIYFALYILSLLFFVIFVFFRKSVVPIQNILIFQYTYFCVMGQKQVKLAISSLSYFGKYLTGFNIDVLKAETSQFLNIDKCQKLASIYQQCNPVDNINITFCLAILLLIITLIAMCIKYRKQKLLYETYKQEKTTKNQTEGANQIDNESVTESNKTYNQLELIYEFPQKVMITLVIFMEFFSGVVFMTSIEYLINAISLNSENTIICLAWLGLIGVVFVVSWSYWYKNYPIRQLSYISIIKYQVSKFSISKFAYFIQFMFLIIWGAVVSTAPGIVSYSLLLVWTLIWLYFVLFAKIYKSRIHTMRSIINQIITILIVVIFVLMQYLNSDDMGLIFSIAILGLLVLSLSINVGMLIYNEYLERKMQKKLVQDKQALKNVEEEFKNYSSRKKDKEKEQRPVNNINFYAQETPSPHKLPLIQDVNGSQSKTSQLRSFKKQLQMNVKGTSDEKKVQIQSTLRNINNSLLYEQELSVIDDEEQSQI